MFVDLAIDNGVLYWTQNLQDNLNSAKLPGFTEPKNMIRCSYNPLFVGYGYAN